MTHFDKPANNLPPHPKPPPEFSKRGHHCMLVCNTTSRSPIAVTGWCLTIALLLLRLLPMLFQPGMFLDGVIYTSVARNMAAGEGDFWHPHANAGDTAVWYEEPPVGIWLESLALCAMGDHYWVEKIYSAITGLLTAVVLGGIWRQLFRERPTLGDFSWLPAAVWIALPSWSWMYQNNMLENTLGLFATASVYCSLRATAAARTWLPWLAAAALCTLAAVLTKGPVGMFPLVTPLVIALTLGWQRAVKGLMTTATLGTLFALALAVALMNPDARQFLSHYLHSQVLASMAGHRDLVASRLGRFDILWKIVGQLALPVAAAGWLIVWTRRREANSGNSQDHSSANVASGRSTIAFALLTALSASLPIMLSAKQAGHYAFPSFAFYSLALALWCTPTVISLLASQQSESQLDLSASAGQSPTHRNLRWLAVGTAGALVVATILLAGEPHRDGEIYHDTLVLRTHVPRFSAVGIGPELAGDYSLMAYLSRWDDIRADSGPGEHQYWLSNSGGAAPDGYTLVEAGLQRYRLFVRTAGSDVTQAEAEVSVRHGTDIRQR